jgi:hypothetical protein
MGDFNFDLQNKNFRFSEFMEHTFSSKQIVSKITRKYKSLLDLAFLKVYFKYVKTVKSVYTEPPWDQLIILL